MIARYVKDFLFEASSEELYNKFYKDIKPDIYNKIIKADPTSTDKKNGKYCKWLLDLYKNKKLLIEDLYKATEYLTLFNKYGSKLQKNQIQMYKSLPELFQEIKQFQEKVPQEDLMSNKDKYKDIKENQTEKCYEDNEWLVVVPKTKESSCFWGQGTQWCTAAKKTNKFNYYNKKGPLYIVINKRLKDNEGRQLKYQFHFKSGQFMNSNDSFISKEDCNLFNDNLKKFLKSKIILSKIPMVFWWTQNMGDREEMKPIILKSKKLDYIYKWAKEIGDREEMKPIILKSKKLGYIYKWAKEIGDREEMKPIILKSNDPEYAYKWGKYVGNREEMKSIILNSNDPEYVYKWAKEIGDREEMKSIILKSNNLQYAYWWAKIIGDKEEMKNVILKTKDIEYAYYWAKEIGDREEMKSIILNGNNLYYVVKWVRYIGDREEMKQIILKADDPEYAYEWATDIGDKDEMKQIILKSNDPEYAYKWSKNIGDKEEMKPIVFNSNKEDIINGWKKYIE